ncbi:MbnP family protein [Tenacibaculum aestuariivivum]|uniref:MbnP family protein n=1 Tax=Tenacibaculum aestuariivivum TaxID=2006131 RepID=UPI003AB55567
MKRYLVLCLSIILFSCSSDNDEPIKSDNDEPIKEVTVKVNFSQNWDGTTIEKSDLSTTEFTNKLGTKLTIDRLRYLISKITLTNGNEKATIFDGYQLVDLSDNNSLIHNLPEKIKEGSYNLTVTFGFNENDNIDGNYQDLNTASWNVPIMLGGGYHFMQLDGKYKNSTGVQKAYNYHVIRAYNTATKKAEDTSFSINLGSITIKNNATIEIKMNIAEWFKDPYNWDLNDKNINLMMNYDAQKLMNENGKTGVFSLGTISQ